MAELPWGAEEGLTVVGKTAQMSRTQATVIAKIRQAGTHLEHWRGGFWTYPGCFSGTRDGIPIPTWSVSTVTVRAMRRRGWLEPVPSPENLAEPAWKQKLQPTEAGIIEQERSDSEMDHKPGEKR